MFSCIAICFPCFSFSDHFVYGQASSKKDLIIALGDARKELVTGAIDDALKLAVDAHTKSIHAAVVAAIDAGREKGISSIQVTVVEEFN